MPIADLHKELLGLLDDKYKNIENNLIIDEAISSVYTDRDINFKKVKSMYLNNKKDIVSSMKLCIETLINPYELLNNTNYTSEVFLSLYNNVVLEDNYFMYISKILDYISNENSFKYDYQGFLSDKNIKDSNLVIFINFEIITPPQLLLIRLLQRAGYTTLFIVQGKYINAEQIIKNYVPKVNEVIYSTYKNIADIEYFPSSTTNLSIADVFLSLIEGDREEAKIMLDNIKLYDLKFIKRSSKSDYAEFIHKSWNEGMKIYSLNGKDDKNILKTFYGTDIGTAKKFEDNPLGRFILNLYNMFNRDGTMLDFDSFVQFNENTLLKAFQYEGLCNDNSQFAASYREDLKDLLYWLGPQLNNKSSAMWIDALDKLIENRDRFELKYIKIPAFQIECTNLKIIRDFFVTIKNLVELLFIIRGDEEERVNYTLVEFLEKVSVLIDVENINVSTSEGIEELEILKGSITNAIYSLSESEIIRNLRVEKNYQLADQIKSFLLNISYKEPKTPSLIDSLNSFRDCASINSNIEENKVLITNFNKFNLSKVGDYTMPLNKTLIFEYAKNIKIDSDYDRLKHELVNASLNILDTSFLQMIRAFYLHLKNNKTVTVIRFADNSEDNANYFENLLCNFLNLAAEDLGDTVSKSAAPYKLDICLDAFRDKDLAINTVFKRSRNIDDAVYCPRRVFYNTFCGEFVKDYYILENNIARMLYKACYIRKNSRNYDILDIENMLSIIFPGKSANFKNDVLCMVIANIKNSKGAIVRNTIDPDFFKNDIFNELKKEKILFDATSEDDICKKCSANCTHKHI